MVDMVGMVGMVGMAGMEGVVGMVERVGMVDMIRGPELSPADSSSLVHAYYSPWLPGGR